MCRLLGYATNDVNASLHQVLGMRECAAFRDLSVIHNDGWGAALITEPAAAAHVTDGGAPSPETGSALYRNTIAAHYDPIFDDLASVGARSALFHLRLASSNLPLILENQHPFFANGLSFIHNGDISDAQGRNITTNRSYPIDHSLVQETGGRSDSAIYFATVLQYLGVGYELEEALAQAVRELRAAYPDSSYNCMIQSKDTFIALRAESGGPTRQGVVDVYARYGRANEAGDYAVLRYRDLAGATDDTSLRGVVVTSSGYAQPETEGWRELGNNQMIVASNRTGDYRIRAI
ncbi:MAG: class II glutamine amidotransferase [Bifidobacterium choerinum]